MPATMCGRVYSSYYNINCFCSHIKRFQVKRFILPNMMWNNNSSKQNAVVRFAELPVVRSACALVAVLYIDTKYRHPSMKTLCEIMESGATTVSSVACNSVYPAINKMEPQLTSVNDLACKGLDWLDTALPMLQMSTDEIVASAKNKIGEVKDMVSIVRNGTVDCVQLSMTWMIGKGKLQVTDRTREISNNEGVNLPLVERVISAAGMGLDCALNLSESLVDVIFPQIDMEQNAKAVEGFEVSPVRHNFSARLVSLSGKMYRRTLEKTVAKMYNVQEKLGVMLEGKDAQLKQELAEVLNSVPRPPDGVVQQLQTSCLTLARSVHSLPQYLHHQAVCVLFFMSQMCNLSCSTSHRLPTQVRVCLDISHDYMLHNTPVTWLKKGSVGTAPCTSQATNGQTKRRPLIKAWSM